MRLVVDQQWVVAGDVILETQQPIFLPRLCVPEKSNLNLRRVRRVDYRHCVDVVVHLIMKAVPEAALKTNLKVTTHVAFEILVDIVL